MTNKEVVEKFYQSFAKGDAAGMTSCYHKDVTFQDPAFGKLEGVRAMKMWEMLMSRRTDSTKISFKNIEASNDKGSASWTADYVYGDKQRPVNNVVNANFKFKDGKIIEHIDDFNLWSWSKQALGAPGYLLGWTPFMKSKIQNTTKMQLDKFMNK